jgi:arylsulfatase A-like enzyme
LRNFILFIALSMPTTLVAADKPNVIIIFTDDQGYQDVGCFGSPLIKTPHLDKMAAEGVRFTDFYSANSVCSPSRAALLTGCYPPRVGVTRVLFPKNSNGLSPNETTIADMLKEQDYATACIGKWHLGHKEKFLPPSNGFDQYFGIPYSNDMTVDPKAEVAENAVFREGMTLDSMRHDKPKKNWVPLMRDTKIVEYPADQTTLTKRYTEEALAFIDKNKEKPFFLYLAHTMPHIPLFASEEFSGKSERGLYGDVIEEIDANVGKILDHLRKTDLDKKTFVVYTSDNGPWKLDNGRGGSALPLRGYKFQTYEGGMREPAIAWMPGTIKAGQVCSELTSTIDLLPTIAHITGATLPENKIDGKNAWPLYLGDNDAKTPHDAYFYCHGDHAQAVRAGEWKLREDKGTVELFNLSEDISETTNLASKYPEKVASLQAIRNAFNQEISENKR